MARSDPWLRRTAWTVWAVGLGVIVAGFVVLSWTPSAYRHQLGGLGAVAGEVAFLLMGYSFASVGLLVVLRQPRHRLGWFLLLVPGPAIFVSVLLDTYALVGLVASPGSLPGAAAVAALNQGSWVWAIGSIAIFVVLLFPDGRLPSPRWRWLAWVGALDVLVIWLVIAVLPGKLDQGPGAGLGNPLGIAGHDGALTAVFITALVVLPLCIVAAAMALVLRFRRSHGTERLQLKWFAAAAALVATTYLIAMAAQFLKPTPFSGPDPWWLSLIQNVASLSFFAFPAAIAAAILRHRLYDIDVVIKRTVVYGSLTVTLAVVYFAVVLTLRSLTDSVAGHSDLAVAASTLVVAGLFRPLRRRIQTVVDRRFYRRSYDAARTVDSFSERLRQEVDLDSVTTDLRHVVSDTMQPTQVSLWLRAPGSRA
ncbi:MAG: hypothetical protein JOZ82_01805 [Marmoricola sp.]|nr:hypothetical protein [Marmoricola sp.]